jgi:hypothetical protein
VVWEFFAATNAADLDWLTSLFSERCTVTALGLPASGLPAVAHWLETEIVEPPISLRIEEVGCHDTTTTIRCRASDRGLVHDCVIAFQTQGRYIEALAITATQAPSPIARFRGQAIWSTHHPCERNSIVRDSRDHHPSSRAGAHP